MKLKHSVYDTDTHFSINPATRELINESLQKTSLVQYDHNCERFTFALPRTIEGHDMSKCDFVQVHYLNVDAQTKAQSKGVYDVDDMQISPDGDDVVICSWLIPCTATEYVGSLSFLLRFCCIADDGKTLSYAWHTAIYSGIAVSNGIYNGEFVAEEFPEILKEWEKELQNNMIASVEQTTATAADGGLNVWTMKMGDGRTFDFRVYNGRAGDVTIIQQPPQFVDSIEECTDPTKLYVLPDGYIYHYRNTTIVHPAEREETDVGITDRYRISTSQLDDGTVNVTAEPRNGYCVTDMINLTDMPRPCYINLKGVRWGGPSGAGSFDPFAKWVALPSVDNFLAQSALYGPSVLAPIDNDDFKVVHNDDTFTDVTITIKSDRVKLVSFSGVYEENGGAGSYDTAEAVLYYNLTEETVEKVEGWYSTGHTWGGGEGGAGVGILRITESTVDGGSNVVTFTDGKTLTIKNGKKGSAGAQGEKGEKGEKGDNYVLTEADRAEIAQEAKDLAIIKADTYGLPCLYLTGDTAGIDHDNVVALNYVYGERNGTCTLKWQGSSSLSYPKKNYTVNFDNSFEAAEGWGEQKKYCLKANFIDHSHARNIVSARLWGEVVKSRPNYTSLPELLRNSPNQGAVDGFPLCVFINGVYQGVYTWNIPKDGWMFNMGSGEKECIMCANKHSAPTRFEAVAVCDETDFEIEYVPDEDNTQWAIDALNALVRAVMASDGTDIDSALANYVDIDSVIDFYIFTALITGADNYDKNYILATYDGIKWFFSTYDMDGTWGLSPGGNAYYSAVTGSPTIKNFNHKLIKLIQSYKTDAVKNRYAALRETVLSEANVMLAFSNFFAAIPKGLYNEDVKLWPTIPGSSANNLNQILHNYRIRVIEMDKQMDELEAQDVIFPPYLATGGTWYRGATSATDITQINIVSSYTAIGNETETFNADTNNTGSIKGYINGTVLTLAPTTGARKINLPGTATGVFSAFKNLEEFNGSELLTTSGGASYMLSAFDGLSKLTSKITLPEGVTSMASCFVGCSSMTEPPNIPSTVTNLNCAFFNCSSLQSVPAIPTNFTGDCESMFSGCKGVTSLDGFVVPEGVTKMKGMFVSMYKVGESTVTINAQSLETHSNAFLNVAIDTGKTVTLVGTCPLLNELAATNTQGRVVVGL